MDFSKNQQSFTLVELLIVIGILAVLTAAVIVIINPTEYLRQARDTTRMSDLGSINQALSVLESQGTTSFGTAKTVYVSIADASSTCANLGLPTLPATYSYNCVSSSTLQKTDGTGWIPVSFSSASALSFSNLPIDPVNTTSTGNYYTYTPGGSWELTTLFESSKYASREATDGGVDLAQYEVGSNLTLSPFAHGLVGYWKFDEGSGTSVSDSSGYGRNGTMYTSSTPAYILTTTNCRSGSCANFDGVGNIIGGFSGTNINFNGKSFSVSLWTSYCSNAGPYYGLVSKGQSSYAGWSLDCNNFMVSDADGPWNSIHFTSAMQWTFVVGVLDVPANKMYLYQNGVLVASQSVPATTILSNGIDDVSANLGFGGRYLPPTNNVYRPGLTDDIRIYSRALSVSEISAIYNATK